MSWLRMAILSIFLLLSLTACGGGSSSSTRVLMGGSIQGTSLVFNSGISGTYIYDPFLGYDVFRNFTTQGAASTFAGNATSGSADGVGGGAGFWKPSGMTTDGTSLYVADSGNCTIRKIDIVSGTVSTLAGSAGNQGSADGIGAQARFRNLSSMGITTDGTTLYLADSGNNTIRRIGIAFGNVSTLAGLVGTAGSADGAGLGGATFNNPQGITTDGTNLYVADSGNSTIRKIVIATRQVSTFAGSPGIVGFTDGIGTSARFYNPRGITTDGSNLYVADSGNSTIRKIVIATGQVTTLAGSPLSPGVVDGVGSFARFSGPLGITTDGRYLYVTDAGAVLRKVLIATGQVKTLAGKPGEFALVDGTGDAVLLITGVPLLYFGPARFWLPQGLTTDGKNLYVADTTNNAIRKIY